VDIPDYDLPAQAIAQEPVEPRDGARLLVGLDPSGAVDHRRVADLPELVGPGDLVVVNTTRVLPARLRLRKQSGGVAEVLLLAPIGAGGAGGDGVESAEWTALVRPGRRLPPGTVLWAGEEPVLEVGARVAEGCRRVRLLVAAAAGADRAGDDGIGAAGSGDGRTVADLLERVGTLPLPPYIHRPLADPARYQTVYADQPGSVAAPTAGLHLTRAVLDGCAARGCQLATVELAVGLGTFRPVQAARAEDHHMHRERYRVPPATMAACGQARRVLAVGTTTLRALESAATGRLEGDTDLYIYGRFPFQVVDVLLTNFHQPRSSLLLLLDAFCGPRWKDLYRVALEEGYRFLSFGDAMVVARHDRAG
jgi:S-adenosylmethionine:tRNA ribosyltransferase-isomerase